MGTRRDSDDFGYEEDRPRRRRRHRDDEEDDIEDGRPAPRLIQCLDCRKPVSRNARSCPNCGSPLKATTIERTGKTWKATQLVGGLMSAVGFGLMFTGMKDTGILAAAGLCVVVGLLTLLVGIAGAWWFHG